MLRYNIARLKASANGRPEGYVKYVLAHGKVDGDFILLPDAIEDGLAKKFPSAEFEIAQLKHDGRISYPRDLPILSSERGQVKGQVIELDLVALDELHEKFRCLRSPCPKSQPWPK